MANKNKIARAQNVILSTVGNEGIEENRIPNFIENLLTALDEIGNEDEFTIVEQEELEEFCKTVKVVHDYRTAGRNIENVVNEIEAVKENNVRMGDI